jgi:hypothetical protein
VQLVFKFFCWSPELRSQQAFLELGGVPFYCSGDRIVVLGAYCFTGAWRSVFCFSVFPFFWREEKILPTSSKRIILFSSKLFKFFSLSLDILKNMRMHIDIYLFMYACMH